MLDALRDQFTLSADELDRPAQLATVNSTEAHDLFQFTRVIDAPFAETQERRPVEAAWQVAFTDGES